MTRYSMARLKGSEAYRQVLKEDAELLALYGLRLMGIEGGVSAAVEAEIEGNRIDPWVVVEINGKAWKWLYPLLLRLRKAEARVQELEKQIKRMDQSQSLAAK